MHPPTPVTHTHTHTSSSYGDGAMISLSGAQHAARVAMHLLAWKVCEAAILHALFDKQKSECKETAIMLPELAVNFEKNKDEREKEREREINTAPVRP